MVKPAIDLSQFNNATPLVMHVDLNSCFASIEQQARPKLRGRPVVIVNRACSKTSIITASYEAKKLGVKANIVEGKWDGLLTGLSTGTYDLVINGVDITKEREKKFDFSTPYAYDHTVLVVRNDNTTITSFDDLKGKTTANSIGSTYMELGEDYGATVKGVDDLTKCMDLVKSGGVDATINAATSINDYLQTTKDTSFKIVDQSKESTPYAIPMVKGDDNVSLKKAVNKALKELKEDGTLSKISIKYFGEDLTKE